MPPNTTLPWQDEISAMRPYLVRITENARFTHEDAEDIVSDVLIQALRVGYNPNKGATVRTWIIGLTQYRWMKLRWQHGRLKHKPSQVVQLADVESAADPHAGEGVMLAGAYGTALYALLARLPERERIVIRTSFFGEMGDSAALAEEWGVSGGRIYQIRAQALDRMRRWAEEDGALTTPG